MGGLRRRGRWAIATVDGRRVAWTRGVNGCGHLDGDPALVAEVRHLGLLSASNCKFFDLGDQFAALDCTIEVLVARGLDIAAVADDLGAFDHDT